VIGDWLEGKPPRSAARF